MRDYDDVVAATPVVCTVTRNCHTYTTHSHDDDANIMKGCYIAHLIRPGLHYVGAKWLNARACYLTSLRALLYIYMLYCCMQRSPSGLQMRLIYGLLQRHRIASRPPFGEQRKQL